MCEDTCDTAALVISELVTNAIVHTASDVVVCELYDGDDVVRIAVRDEGCAPGEPHPSPQRPEEEHGRGLLLVEALCHSWGAQEHGSGLLVWADLPRRADASEASGEQVEPSDSLVSDLAQPYDDVAPEHAEPRDDLGWGARPKPSPADGSDEEAEPAEQAHRAAATAEPVSRTDQGIPPSRHRIPDAGAQSAPSSVQPPHPAPETGAPLPRVAPQWHHGPEEHVPDLAPHGHGTEHAGPAQSVLAQSVPAQSVPAQSVPAHDGPDVRTPNQQASAHHPADHRPPTHTAPQVHSPGPFGGEVPAQQVHNPGPLGDLPAPRLRPGTGVGTGLTAGRVTGLPPLERSRERGRA